MSGVSISRIAATGVGLAAGLGAVLALDPAEAAARNERIRTLTAQRRDRREALESAARCAADERERLAQAFVTARVDAAAAAAALVAVGLPVDPRLVPPPAGADVERWCHDVPDALREVGERARSAAAGQALQRLRAGLPDPGVLPLVDPADLPDPGDAPHDAAEVTVVLTRMLATLSAVAGVEDRALVERTAAQVAGRSDRSAHITQLRLHIQQANDRAELRRVDAVTAGQLLDAMEPYSVSHGLDPDLLGGARADLAEVVAGRRVLDDGLLDRVAALREHIEARAAALAVTDAIADVLQEVGYEVGADLSVGEAVAGRLEISHRERPDHVVRMRVDAASRELTAMVVRSAGGVDPAADVAAEAAWCGVLDQAIAKLAGSGVVLTPTLLARPAQEVEAAARTGESHGERQRQIERRRGER